VRSDRLDVLHQAIDVFEHVLIDALKNVPAGQTALVEEQSVCVVNVPGADQVN
jgi:hypothetical protein